MDIFAWRALEADLRARGFTEVDAFGYAAKLADPTHWDTEIHVDHQWIPHHYYKAKAVTPRPPAPAPGPTPPPAPGPTPPPPPPSCGFPSTQFKNSVEGNEFRVFVNDNFSDLATDVDLDRRGKFNNCYIREAYATVPTGFALSAGEIFLASKKDPNFSLDNYKKDAYSQFKQRQKEEQTYSTDSAMWQDLIDKGELWGYGEIKKLKGGTAVYIVKYDLATGNKVKMGGSETSSISDIIPDMKEFEYVTLLPPTDRNKKPLRGDIGVLTVKKDVNGDDYISIVKEKGSNWTAFDKGMTFDEMNEVNESIIGKVLRLIKEEGEGDGINRSGKTNTNTNTNTTTDNKTKTEVVCTITPEQKVDLDAFLLKNKDSFEGMVAEKSADGKTFTLTSNEDVAQDVGQYTIVKLKELKYNDNRAAVRDAQNIPDACIAYKRTTIQNEYQNQVEILETWLNGAKVNLTTKEPAFGGKTGSYPLKLGDIIPDTELADFRLQDQADVTVYIKDPTKVERDTSSCKDAVKALYACMAGKKGGGVLQCGNNNIAAIVSNKLSAYFCTALVRGEGKFWTNLGLGKEFSYIKDDAGQSGSLYSIKNMVEDSPLRESRLDRTIRKTIIESVRTKNDKVLSESVRKTLSTFLK